MCLSRPLAFLTLILCLCIPAMSQAEDCVEACDEVHALCVKKQGSFDLCNELGDACSAKCVAQPKEEPPSESPDVEPVVEEPVVEEQLSESPYLEPIIVEPEPEPEPEPEGDYYRQIIIESRQLGRDWNTLIRIVCDEGVLLEKKIEATRHFIGQYGTDHEYANQAKRILDVMEQAESSGGVSSKELCRKASRIQRVGSDSVRFYREKMEWFSLRGGVGASFVFGGAIDGSATATMFTFRWKHFYWSMLRGTFNAGPHTVIGRWGSSIGIPIMLNEQAHNELRLGIVAEFGGGVLGSHGDKLYLGVFTPGIEFLYVKQLHPRFGIILGIDAHLFLNDTTVMDDNFELQSVPREFVPRVGAFIGFTI